MMRYRKKPVEIEAWQVGGDEPMPTSFHVAIDQEIFSSPRTPGEYRYLITTIDKGYGYAETGDWIIRGVQGEFYPCKDEIFRATYEPATVQQAVAESLKREFGYVPREAEQWCVYQDHSLIVISSGQRPRVYKRGHAGSFYEIEPEYP